MEYPPDHDPIWIDWNRAHVGGLRFVAYTDEAGEPHTATAHLDRFGQMIEPPHYSDRAEGYATHIFHCDHDPRQLWRFTFAATGRGLLVTVRPVPSHLSEAQTRLVEWFGESPVSSF